jgi:hypothetical protein
MNTLINLFLNSAQKILQLLVRGLTPLIQIVILERGVIDVNFY